MHPLPRSVQTPESEVVVDGLPRWEVVGQQSPGAAAPQDVEDGVEDLAQAMEARTPVGSGSGKMGLQAAPLGVGKVGLWYALLMLGMLPSERLSTPFQTVSWQSSRKFSSEAKGAVG